MLHWGVIWGRTIIGVTFIDALIIFGQVVWRNSTKKAMLYAFEWDMVDNKVKYEEFCYFSWRAEEGNGMV